MDTTRIDWDKVTDFLRANNPIDPHNSTTGFGFEGSKNFYIAKGMPIRLEIATRLAPMIKAPDFYPMSDELTGQSHQRWTERCFLMADALIEKYNKDLKANE